LKLYDIVDFIHWIYLYLPDVGGASACGGGHDGLNRTPSQADNENDLSTQCIRLGLSILVDTRGDSPIVGLYWISGEGITTLCVVCAVWTHSVMTIIYSRVPVDVITEHTVVVTYLITRMHTERCNNYTLDFLREARISYRGMTIISTYDNARVVVMTS